MGGKPLAKSGIYQIFSKPFYYGRFEYPSGSGQWYKGKHEPMITEAQFQQVQTLLGRDGNPRAQSHYEFAFTGLIHCGDCGRMVTAEEKHQVICGTSNSSSPPVTAMCVRVAKHRWQKWESQRSSTTLTTIVQKVADRRAHRNA